MRGEKNPTTLGLSTSREVQSSTPRKPAADRIASLPSTGTALFQIPRNFTALITSLPPRTREPINHRVAIAKLHRTSTCTIAPRAAIAPLARGQDAFTTGNTARTANTAVQIANLTAAVVFGTSRRQIPTPAASTTPCQSPETNELPTNRETFSTPRIRFRSITVIDPPPHGHLPQQRSPLSDAAAPPESPHHHPVAKAAAVLASCRRTAASYDELQSGLPPARPRRDYKETPCPPAGAAHSPSSPESGSSSALSYRPTPTRPASPPPAHPQPTRRVPTTA